MLLLSIIKIIIYRIDNNNNNKVSNKQNMLKYSDIRHKLKTGDIICFSTTRFNTILDKLFYHVRATIFNFDFSHAGIVLKINDVLYLIEASRHTYVGNNHAIHLNNKKNGGVRIVNLDRLLYEHYNKAKSHFGIKFISKEIDNNILLNQLNNYTNKCFHNKLQLSPLILIYMLFPDEISTILGKYYSSLVSNHIMCTEFIHNILYNLHILKEYPSIMFWPMHLNDESFKKYEIVKYSPMYNFSIK